MCVVLYLTTFGMIRIVHDAAIVKFAGVVGLAPILNARRSTSDE